MKCIIAWARSIWVLYNTKDVCVILSVVVQLHCSFRTRQRYPCKLESSTECFFYQTYHFNFQENHAGSDAFAMSDVSVFASILKFSSKLISTHGSAVWLKLVTVPSFLRIACSLYWKGFELWSFLDCVVNSLTAEGQLSSQLTYFFCVSNGLVFLINDTGLSFVFKNLFVKSIWHTKIFLRESQFVKLKSFRHICSKSSFLDCELSVLFHNFYT